MSRPAGGFGAVATARRPFSRLAEIAVGRLLFRHAPLRGELVADLRREAAALRDGAATASALWNEQRARLRDLLVDGDPATFLRWEPVRRTMVRRGHRRIAHALAHLRSRADWRTRWRPALREVTLGTPRPFPRYPWTSANLIFHAYHLCRFEEVTATPLERMGVIVEFGGGYGRLCQMVHDLGFSGRYVIVDLPEVAALQRFYLRHVGIDVVRADGPAWPATGVVSVVDLDLLAELLRARPTAEAAFVAIASLSETPIAVRERVLAAVTSFDAFLLFYMAREEALDNAAYFTGWAATLPDHDWRPVDLPHRVKLASYLFGRRRNPRAPSSVTNG